MGEELHPNDENYDGKVYFLGKWSQGNVPHKGWSCVDMEDVEEDFETCEMCERAEIRYVHIMVHDNYGTLRCGCICAAHMSEDYKGAKQREKDLVAEFRRRKAFMKKEWRSSARGNAYLKKDGFVLVIVEQYKKYKVGISGPSEDDEWTWGNKRYDTMDLAKDAGWKALKWAKKRKKKEHLYYDPNVR